MANFNSKEFNPTQALANSDLEITEGKAYTDLYELLDDVHKRSLKQMADVEIVPGGSGGFPPQPVRQGPRSISRRFHEDQGPVPAPSGKRLNNVMLRMEEIQGPLALLRQCRDANTRIKVYTRKHSQVRSILTGHVVAFDKYWNLVLRDVEEVFQRKIRYPRPSLDDVANYVKIDDLSIRADEDELGYRRERSCVWQNPFAKTRSHYTDVKSETVEDPRIQRHRVPPEHHPLFSASDRGSAAMSRDSGRSSTHRPSDGKTKENLSICGVRLDARSVERNSSRGKDIKTLHLSCKDTQHELEGATTEAAQGIKAKSWQGSTKEGSSMSGLWKELNRVKEETVDEEREEEKVICEKQKNKRRRRRRKYDIRERHVKQMLIRGENVVLISVLKV